jgi:ATP-dependent RNA circularization protein (DNA/RNA ligase family)
MLLMREQIERQLDGAGELVVNKISGALLASDRGGFIKPYVSRRHNKLPPGPRLT